MMPAIYGNSYQIQQGPGVVTITYEMVHDTRVIPLDGRPHLTSSVRQYLGDARGRWEGHLTRDESQPPFDYACHEGNYGLRNILAAARAEAKK